LSKIFRFYNVGSVPYDYTDVDYKNEGKVVDIRKIEIDDYISDNNITNYLIIDDLPLKYNEDIDFVHCNKSEGLKQIGIKFNIMKKLKMV